MDVGDRCVWLDLESTGLDPDTDRIVEVALIEIPSGEIYETLVNPLRSIPAEATEVHGITAEMLADAPVFADIAPMLQAVVTEQGSDTGPPAIGTFNGRRFDVPLLDAELRRAGQPGFPRDKAGRVLAPDLDLYAVWAQVERRNLAAALKRFAGIEQPEGLHRATQDVAALPKVLAGMAEEFGFNANNVAELVALSTPEGTVDRAGKFIKVEDRVCFNFGKHRDEDVRNHLDYLSWMIEPGRDFPHETQAVARYLLARYGGDT